MNPTVTKWAIAAAGIIGISAGVAIIAQDKTKPPPLTPIQHIVVIIQENRTVDNLFSGLPGADTTLTGKTKTGTVQLQAITLATKYDIGHSHPNFLKDYDGGKNDGFECGKPSPLCSYGYVPRGEVQPYFDMATQYAFADRMFQTNQGPSFPAHQYLISGTSTTVTNGPLRASSNPNNDQLGQMGGCSSVSGTTVKVIDAQGSEAKKVFPCFERLSLTDLLDSKQLTWKYYQETPTHGLWNALDAIKHIYDTPEYTANVISPSPQFLKDMAAGKPLANVTWITPGIIFSDHAGHGQNGSGPSWVAAVVNAVGESSYWNSTTIIVTWDDWGGWYDHVPPTVLNSYELGFRVPLVVISPYARVGYVSHTQHEFGSILKYVEENFGTGSLNTTDVRADDLSDMFDMTQTPIPFKPISAPLLPSYFTGMAPSDTSPDGD